MKLRYISRTAAVIFAAAAVFAAAGLKPSDTELPKSAAFSPKPQIAAENTAMDGTGDDPVGSSEVDKTDGDENDSDESKADNSSSENAEKAGSDGLSPLPEDNNDASDSGESRGDGGRRRQLAPESPSADDDELPGGDPQDGDETEEQLFTTSIRDGEHVSKSLYSFTITHLNKSYKLKTLTVKVNGRKVPWSGSVTLADGSNSIRIYASYTDRDGQVHSGFREYTVWLDSADTRPDSKPSDKDSLPDEESLPDDGSSEESAPEHITEPRLVTDLSDMTTSAESISFTAYIEGGENAELKAYIGGRRLTSADGEYTCTLNIGLNTIKLKGSADFGGERCSFEQSFVIRRTAETTPETAPHLVYNNVPESVRGDTYTLDLIAEDYTGERIYDNGITVLLGGTEIKCSWVGEYTSYLLKLTGGENTLDIRVRDSEGRSTDYAFVIVCSAAEDGEVIGVCSIRMDAAVLGLGDLMPDTDMEIRQGESAVDAIVRTLEENGFTVELRGAYIARISREGMAYGAAIPEPLREELEADNDVRFSENYSPDSIGERDFTSLSGWMIAVNGHYISYGAGDLHLKDGDLLQLRFTLAAGRDIGDSSAGELYENVY